MTTRMELRERVRRQLEDLAPAPLWDDAVLHDALSDGLLRYGARVPLQARSLVAVSAGARSFVVPGLEAGAAISDVFTPNGLVVPPALAASFDEPRQAWRWWAGEVLLAKPAAAGSWTVEWRRPRLLPPGDSDPMPVNAGDEGLVTLFAAASALRRRAIESAKRGGTGAGELLLLATELERQARVAGRQVRSFTALEC